MSNENIKKATPDHHQRQMEKREELRKKIKSFNVCETIIKDTDEFFDTWYEEPIVLDIDVYHGYHEGKECVEIIWDLQDEQTLKVLFFGRGIWKYDLTIFELNKNNEKSAATSFSFYGKAYTYSLKDSVEENFIFYFDDYVQNKIQLQESLSKEYEGLVTIERSSSEKQTPSIGHEMKYGWHTNFYDGPISGYVYKNKELHYFNEIEETLFKRQRVFAIYPLTIKQKLYAIYRHHLFEYVVHNKNKKIYDWYFGLGKWKEKADKKRQELMKQPKKYLHEGKPIVGYFTL